MYSYMVGKIVSVNKKTITFENNYVGYCINVTNPSKYEVNKVKKLYLYKHMCTNNKNNLVEEFYGFDKYEVKEFFLSLITTSGIGPKTAINICNHDLELLKQFIKQRDAQGLSTLDGITPKYARLIVDNLCDAFGLEEINSNFDITKLVQALKSLGYGSKEIDIAIKGLDPKNLNIELSDLISQAIKIIATGESYANIATAN